MIITWQTVKSLFTGQPDKEGWRPAFLMVIGALILLPNLGETYFWMDEAETAVLGKNILTYGYPRMFDGRNLMVYYPPLHNEAFAEIVLPWLQYYVTAGSFFILGVNTFAGRFPFVVCGLVAIGLYPFVVRRLTSDKRVVVLAPWLMTVSVPLLLYFRQCRYYGLVIVFTLWLILAYLRLADKRKWAGLHLTLAAIGLFHSHYVVCAGTLIGLGFHWLTVYSARIRWTTILFNGLVFLSGTLPWILYAQFWRHGYAWFSIEKVGVYVGTLSARLCDNFAAPLLVIVLGWVLIDRSNPVWRYLCIVGGLTMAGTVMNFPGFPYLTAFCVLVALGRGLYETHRRRLAVPTHLIWMVPGGVIITLALLSPSDEIRYLVGLAPLVFIGFLTGFNRLYHRFPRIAILCFAAAWGTNIFNAIPAKAVQALPFSAYEAGVFLWESDWAVQTGVNRWLPSESSWFHKMVVIDQAVGQLGTIQSYPYEYLYELTHTYDGPLEGIARYLNRFGHPGDTVMIDYGSVPLIFYTSMRLIPEQHLSDPKMSATWVVLHPGYHVKPTADVARILDTEYERVPLAYPNLIWDNRPELWFHFFRQPADSSHIALYRLKTG